MVVDMSCIDNNHLLSERRQTSVSEHITGSMPHLSLLSVPEMLGKRGAADAQDPSMHVVGNAS